MEIFPSPGRKATFLILAISRPPLPFDIEGRYKKVTQAFPLM
jgi:hypothetical protein